MNIKDISLSEEIFTVSRLNREVRFLLEGSFPPIWIEGEISNFVVPYSGHWYFSLKDNMAQVKCAMFKPQNRKLSFTPKDGMQVLIKAKVSLYEGRGDYQIIAEVLEEAGVGKLQREFEELKKRLAEKGLFDEAYKKPLPEIPQSIGIITSSTGAAVRDILNVLKRRFPYSSIIIYPTLVQGELAAGNIVSQIVAANNRKECDVIILARGGGSIEDLWAFNEEKVANAIFKSKIPIVTGVGHEIDFTIADFVADVRAPTPSAAAELVTPDKDEILIALNKNLKQILSLIKQEISSHKHDLNLKLSQLQRQHPQHKLKQQAQTLDSYQMKILKLMQEYITNKKMLALEHATTLQALSPSKKINRITQKLDAQHAKISNIINDKLKTLQLKFINVSAKLDTLSPLSTLSRGYAIATKNNVVLKSASQVKVKDEISLTLEKGEIQCEVKKL